MEWNDYFTFVGAWQSVIPFFISLTAENAVGFDLELNLEYQSIIIIFPIFSNVNNSNDQEI